jgi:cell wall-associated NlpC family hydrolase
MILKLIPRALVVCACTLFSLSVFAQVTANHQQPNKQMAQIGEPAFTRSDDPVIISMAEAGSARAEEPKAVKSLLTASSVSLARLQPMLSAAIEQRLGSPYRWGSEGPNLFDCSGFVWSTFHSAGIDFERGSARTLWARFEAPAPEENFKYGTLVFFTHQTHVGIVADEHGFYHASRHHGVIYAPFNDYWVKRIDGFRRVPLTAQQALPVVAQKAPTAQ